MKLKISLLTKIIKEDYITFYLLYKDKQAKNINNIILPIEVPSLVENTMEDTYIRTLRTFEAKITSLNIYLYLEGKYYVYLKILYKNKIFDINTNIENALNILHYQPQTDLFIEQNILDQEGISITKEMIDNYESLI